MFKIRRTHRLGIYLLLSLILMLSIQTSVAAQGPNEMPTEHNSYIVFMAKLPALSYEGDIAGLPATKPGKGKKINPNSAHVKKYMDHLKQSHNQALKGAGVDESNKTYDYTIAFNGFAARLSETEVAQVAKQPGVVAVWPDEMRFPATDNTPTFMSLNVGGGPWAKGVTGEGVVVGVIDTGIWPEHPSFADNGRYGPSPIPPLENTPDNPACEFGNTVHNSADVPFTCNNKLLGARQMLSTYRFFIGADPDEYDSARDDDGHGTHTASTAAGNGGAPASMFGIPRGTVSGVAPRARVIAYKGLGKLGGFGSDLAAAIDQAVADGVDVINYSVGGGASLTGADDLAYLFAADAGVFVATSAGNSGPGAGTIGGPASVPWLTSVGASSHSRAFISDVTLSGPGTPPSGIWGGSVTTGIENYNLVDADSIAGGTNGECLDPFPAGTFQANDAVLCNRYNFGTARTQRVANVAVGGGGAVLFQNVDVSHPNMTPTDNHPLPTVHMLNDVGQPLKDYLVANPGLVRVSFSQSVARYAGEDPRVTPNVMASFSSRGPDPVALDIIKPDVTAPGLSILAAASPIHAGSAAQGQYFQAIMGTSMSGPHVAGIFALVKQAHPDWSPAVAKSALMTTAYQDVLKHDYVIPADPFDMGAGHVNPGGKATKGSLFEPGLAYDAGFFEYLGFLCDAEPTIFSDPAGTCGFLESINVPTEAINLNLASIGISGLAGTQTVQRTVTSVAREQGWRTYNVSVDAPPGYNVTVEPSTLRLKSGDTATYFVTITNVSAPIGEWRFGSLTWKDETGHFDVYSPIAVRGALFKAPPEVSGNGESGTTSFDVSFGYTGSYAAAAHGLEPAIVTTDNVVQDPDQNFDPNDGFSNLHQFNLSGAAHFRIAMPPESVADPNIDLDIFVYDPSGVQVASSTSGGTDELIDIELPTDGTWSVYVHGWQTTGASADYDMYSWIISATPGGNLNIDLAPASATLGATETINVSWTGATAGQWHLGAVSHTGDVGLMGLTLVDVDNR